MIDWISSWKKGNKKNDKIGILLRIGRLTILEIRIGRIITKMGVSSMRRVTFRFMLLNWGFRSERYK